MANNKVLTSMPVMEGEYFAALLPQWAAIGGRIASGVFTAGFALIIVNVRHEAPLFMLLFLLMFPLIALLAAFHPLSPIVRAALPSFMVDHLGMYFPVNVNRRTLLAKVDKNRWLFVPWENIMNLRQACARGVLSYGYYCAAFDVKASYDEIDEFIFQCNFHGAPDFTRDDLLPYVDQGGFPVAFYQGVKSAQLKVITGFLEFAKKLREGK